MPDTEQRHISTETLQRYATEVDSLHIEATALEPVAKLLERLLNGVRDLDTIGLADIEPMHQTHLQRWSQ